MVFYRFQLKLWVIGFVGFGWLWGAAPAVADITAAENAVVEAEAVASPRSGHDCFDLATEQPEPLGEFRQAVMETAAVTARAAKKIEDKADALAALSEAYACLGQVELAEAIAQETLPLIEAIEDRAVQGSLLVTFASMYGERLGDVARTNELLNDAIAIAETVSEDAARQNELIGDIVRVYSRMGEYESIREAVDIVEDESARSQLIRTGLYFAEDNLSEAEWLDLLELFPEVASVYVSQAEAEASWGPLQSWSAQLPEFSVALQALEGQADAADALIAAEIVEIEALPDPHRQAMAYIVLSERLSIQDYTVQSLALLESASEKLELSESVTVSAEVEDRFSAAALSSRLSMAFMMAGDFDRGLEVVQNIDATQWLSEKLLMLGSIALFLPQEEHLTTQLVDVLTETEQAARSSQNRSSQNLQQSLLTTATIYAQIDELESTRRLTHEVLENYQLAEDSAGANVDDSFLVELVGLLFVVESYEQGLDLLDSVDDSTAWRYLPSQLLHQNQPGVAWQVFEKISSPFEKIYVLTDMAETYQALEQPSFALDLSIRAFDILQSEGFDKVGYLEYIYGDYLQTYLESFPEDQQDEQLNGWMQATYESSFVEIVFAYEAIEIQRQLLQQIEDETLRARLSADIFFEEAEVSEPPSTDEITDEIVYDDSYWRNVASSAAKDEQFAAAVDAIAMIESPVQQSSTLLKLATCHSYSSTVLEGTTAALLAQLQQQYQ